MRKRRRKLLAEVIGPDLERRCRAWLAANPEPPTEFDRVRRDGMQRYVDLLDELRAKAAQRTGQP